MLKSMKTPSFAPLFRWGHRRQHLITVLARRGSDDQYGNESKQPDELLKYYSTLIVLCFVNVCY